MDMTKGKQGWIDLSIPMTSGMVHWPGDPEPSFERISEMEQGGEANVTLCRMTAHTGTHMDAPCHMLANREGIDAFPLDLAFGQAKVISVPDTPIVKRADLEGKNIRPGDRILLKTRNSNARWESADFKTDFAAIHGSGAEFLAEKQVALIGVDYLSVGAFEGDGIATHRILFEAGVWILEGLNLAQVQDGEYDMICLPLRIEGADGAPARVLVRPRL
jgi:arylformamidase